jgi:hypothetical protein
MSRKPGYEISHRPTQTKKFDRIYPSEVENSFTGQAGSTDNKIRQDLQDQQDLFWFWFFSCGMQQKNQNKRIM